LLELSLDSPSAQRADEEMRKLGRRRQPGIVERRAEVYRFISDADGCAPVLPLEAVVEHDVATHPRGPHRVGQDRAVHRLGKDQVRTTDLPDELVARQVW